MEDHIEQNTNGYSVIAIILGVVSLMFPILGFITAIIGIIYSVKALRKIKETNEPGRGLSIAGLVCSIVSIVLHFIVGVIILLFIIFFFMDVSTGGYYY